MGSLVSCLQKVLVPSDIPEHLRPAQGTPWDLTLLKLLFFQKDDRGNQYIVEEKSAEGKEGNAGATNEGYNWAGAYRDTF